MADSVVWHRVGKEAGRAVYSGGKSANPGKGVWMATLDRADGGQTSTEAIAVDGVTVWQRVCHSGYDRHRAFEIAGDYLLKRRQPPVKV